MRFHPKNTPLGNYTAEELAIEAACSSTCIKSQRGVVLVSKYFDQVVAASNSPPAPFVCDASDKCRSVCNKVAVHAEERAIIRADFDIFEAEMVHIKTVSGEPVSSGPPSCWQCSRMMVEAGISGMWLLRDTGWFRYTVNDFHYKTLKKCGLV